MNNKIIITGKVDKDNYKNFSNIDFLGYEVYLGSDDDFKYLPNMMKRLNITSAHQPTKDFNLCDDGEKGKKSYEIMYKMLTVLDSQKYKGIIVIHGNNYDELLGDREKSLKKLSENINKLANEFSSDVRISLENDALFFNQIGDNKALFVFPEDYKDLEKYFKIPVYITLDFEHVWISSIFRNFYENNPDHYKRIIPHKDLEKKEVEIIKKAWLKHLEMGHDKLEKIAAEALDDFIELKSKIINFHINGSSINDYWFDEKIFLPLAGEHLTIGEKKDSLNYKIIKDYLPKLSLEKNIRLVIETQPRENFREVYQQELIKSANNLRKLIL